MQTQNGPNVCPKCKSVNITNDTRNVSKTSKLLTPPEIELLKFVGYLERPDLVKSLKLIHDLAIYHSDVAFDTKEKTALHDVRVLREKIADMIEKV